MQFEGVFTALVTPFKANGDVDFDAYQSLMEWQADAGVHGFVPCGTTGEGATLSEAEWAQLVQTACAFAKKKHLKAIAGCGSNDTRKVFQMMQSAKEMGADAALIVTPYYNKPTQSGLIAHYEWLAKNTSLPIILYNVPSRTNVTFSNETLKQLFQIENIVGIKEASGKWSDWQSMAYEGFTKKKSLLAGDDDAFAPMMALGGSGIISACSNVAPKAFVDLYTLAKKGQWAEAFALQTKLYPLTKTLFLETNPAPAKYALQVLGKASGALRLPLVKVNSETEKHIQAALKQTGLI